MQSFYAKPVTDLWSKDLGQSVWSCLDFTFETEICKFKIEKVEIGFKAKILRDKITPFFRKLFTVNIGVIKEGLKLLVVITP